jgi:hypothetical protein
MVNLYLVFLKMNQINQNRQGYQEKNLEKQNRNRNNIDSKMNNIIIMNELRLNCLLSGILVCL